MLLKIIPANKSLEKVLKFSAIINSGLLDNQKFISFLKKNDLSKKNKNHENV